MLLPDTLPVLSTCVPQFDDLENVLYDEAANSSGKDRTNHSDGNYVSFVDAVMADECSLYQVSRKTFVCNGWNLKKNQSVVSFIFLVCNEKFPNDICRRLGIICNGHSREAWILNMLCASVPKEGKTLRVFMPGSFWTMASVVFLRMRGCPVRACKNLFLTLLIDTLDYENDTFLFSRTEHHINDDFINLFSVLTHSEYPTIKNRVVVEHTGNDNGDGTWRCLKDTRMTTCPHILGARHCLQKYINADPNATDRNANEVPREQGTSIMWAISPFLRSPKFRPYSYKARCYQRID